MRACHVGGHEILELLGWRGSLWVRTRRRRKREREKRERERERAHEL